MLRCWRFLLSTLTVVLCPTRIAVSFSFSFFFRVALACAPVSILPSLLPFTLEPTLYSSLYLPVLSLPSSLDACLSHHIRVSPRIPDSPLLTRSESLSFARLSVSSVVPSSVCTQCQCSSIYVNRCIAMLFFLVAYSACCHYIQYL